jgi:membrane protein YqaA with SNARE-associated domain
LTEYLIAFAAIFAVNLLPAFGPPTWALLVFCQLQFQLEPAILVAVGALAAASGRYTLALGARDYRGRLGAGSKANLEAARTLLVGNRGQALAGLGLFALSPLPSAQLFVAAGLLRVPLVPLTLAFFSGRVVSYAIYVGGATLASESLQEVLRGSLSSPLGIALQILMLAGLVALVRIDWGRILARRAARSPERRSGPSG